MTVSTENATPPKSTKSRNSNSSVQIQLNPKSKCQFVPRDAEGLGFSIWWNSGVLHFQWKLSYSVLHCLCIYESSVCLLCIALLRRNGVMHANASFMLYSVSSEYGCAYVCVCVCVCMCACLCVRETYYALQCLVGT